MAVVLARALFQHLFHQVGAGHAGGVHIALLAAEFGQRAAVRQGHHGAVLHGLIGGVVVGGHSGVDVGHADVFAAPILQPFFQ